MARVRLDINSDHARPKNDLHQFDAERNEEQTTSRNGRAFRLAQDEECKQCKLSVSIGDRAIRGVNGSPVLAPKRPDYI
jgi:hypothetical protein